MTTAKTKARWQHYERILAQAGIGPDERETILAAEARDRIRAARAEREAREEIYAALTVRP
jgi:hypothetical protein